MVSLATIPPRTTPFCPKSRTCSWATLKSERPRQSMRKAPEKTEPIYYSIFSLHVSNGLVEKKIDHDEFDYTTKSLSTGYVGHGGDFPSKLMVHEEDDGVSEAQLGSLMMDIVV
ncbi:hypothetical protein V8G54_023683 [Vigna mungo]|uniref:Uncharacterized protein n=1 Tax=Vigna mungo TaxID=3915 RepID=A0AAQ3N4R7_VIGMU